MHGGRVQPRELVEPEPLDGSLPPWPPSLVFRASAQSSVPPRRPRQSEEAADRRVGGGVPEDVRLTAGGEDDRSGLRTAEEAQLGRLLEQPAPALGEGHLPDVAVVDAPYLDLPASFSPFPAVGMRHCLKRRRRRRRQRRRRIEGRRGVCGFIYRHHGGLRSDPGREVSLPIVLGIDSRPKPGGVGAGASTRTAPHLWDKNSEGMGAYAVATQRRVPHPAVYGTSMSGGPSSRAGRPVSSAQRVQSSPHELRTRHTALAHRARARATLYCAIPSHLSHIGRFVSRLLAWLPRNGRPWMGHPDFLIAPSYNLRPRPTTETNGAKKTEGEKKGCREREGGEIVAAMATTVSAWAKPGAWALDSEEHEMEMLQQKEEVEAASAAAQEPSADFPSLAAAAAAKTSKKKKGQKVSLAEFNNGGVPVGPGAGKFQVRSASYSAPAVGAKGLTADERLMLPTGPRERTAEELERGNSRGFGYSYGAGGGRSRLGGEDSVSRWDSSRVSGEEPRRGGFSGGVGPNRDLAPSRADEVDDWGAGKRSVAPPMERRERSGGFFDSQSRADESDSWVTNKSVPPPVSESRRSGDGFRERRGFDMFNREAANGGGRPDSDNWGRRADDVGGERPRLKLQPRTLPLADGDDKSKSNGTSPFGDARPREKVLAERGPPVASDDGDRQIEQLPVPKSRGPNPFGAARPREEVLAEKGQDWKEIEGRLDSMKVRETASGVDGHLPARKGFGLGNDPGDQPGDRMEKSWRKPEPVDAPPAAPSVDGADEPAASDNN